VFTKKYILCLGLLICGWATLPVKAEELAGKVSVNYYGNALSFDLSTSAFDKYFAQLSTLSIEEQIHHLIHDSVLFPIKQKADEYAQQLRLDDLGYLKLVQKTTAQLAKKQTSNIQELLNYTLLYYKGFNLLMGQNSSKHLTLYGQLNIKVNNTLFVTYNQTDFYDLSFKPQREVENETALPLPVVQHALPIQINKRFAPQLGNDFQVKIIPFEYDDNLYFFTAKYNTRLVAYLNDLPDIDFSMVYLNYGLSDKSSKNLVQQLQEVTAYMPKSKGVDFILKFVQSLSYAKDGEVWGHEKFSFPEEVIAGDYSDCEDRSMLFAYLVREVLNLQSIGLVYPNSQHMNVAIENWNAKQSYDIKAYNMDFIICEPSGKNIPAGTQMLELGAVHAVKW